MSERLKAITTSLFLALLLFLLDVFYMPAGIVVGIAYVAVVLLSFWSPKISDSIGIAVLCIGLTIVGSLVSPFSDGIEAWYVVSNQTLTVIAILATLMIGLSRKRIRSDVESKLNESNRKLTESANEGQTAVEGYKSEIFRYQALIEALPLNVFQKDINGKLIFGNTRYFETLGIQAKDAIGKTDVELFPPEMANKYQEDDRSVLSEGKTIEVIEEHVKQQTGEMLYVQVFKAPLCDAEEKIIGCQGIFWDVTSRIAAEKAQQATDARFRRIVQSNLLGIVWGDFDGRIFEANKAYLDMLGYQEEDVSELRLNEITPPEYSEVDREVREITLQNSVCHPVEKEFIHKDGHHIPVLVGTAHLEGNECMSFVLDISEQKKAEAELKRAKEEADAANHAKSLFLANMSHEVRTPLNAIIGMTELVLGSPLHHDQSEYLKTVLDSGESLLSVINDILDFSKVEANKLQLEIADFGLRETLSETMRSLAVRAHGKGLEIVFDVAAEVPEMLKGDVCRIRQVLMNLVSNAIKFTDEGEVIVTAVVADQSDSQISLHFSVTDTGIGIAPESREKVFAAFEQADNTSTRKYGGTGLGLAICRDLVKLMGGRIWFESETDVGTTFHFTVKLEVPEQTTDAHRFITGGRVLICDDNQASANTLADMIRRWDLTPAVFLNADDALMEFKQAKLIGKPYEIALIDATMPQKDGFWLLNQLGEELTQENCQPIMLLNSVSAAEDIPKCESQGTASYLLKPIGPSDLFDAISLSMSDAGVEFRHYHESENNQETKIELPPMRVLLAEDSTVNQKLVLGILSKHDVEVVVAGTGIEALNAYEAGPPFDVILMDVQMPEMDGFTATKRIRQIEQQDNSHVPIIAMTAHAMMGDRKRCLIAGMDEYLSKPIRMQRFLELVTEMTSKNIDNNPGKTQSNSETPQFKANSKPTSTPISKPISQNDARTISESFDTSESSEDRIGHVDWDSAMSTVNNDVDLIRHIIDAFAEEAPRLLKEMHDAIESKDNDQLKLLAHTLKGSMRIFGAETGYELAFALENNEEPIQDDTVAKLQSLEQEIECIKVELNSYADQC